MKIQKRIFQLEIVVAVLLIALLWWGAVYKISRLRAQANDEVTLRNKARLMDAIIVYRGDHQGRCPEKLEDLLKAHIERIPHAYRAGIRSITIKSGSYVEVFDGTGGWVYINDPNDDKYCTVHHNIF